MLCQKRKNCVSIGIFQQQQLLLIVYIRLNHKLFAICTGIKVIWIFCMFKIHIIKLSGLLCTICFIGSDSCYAASCIASVNIQHIRGNPSIIATLVQFSTIGAHMGNAILIIGNSRKPHFLNGTTINAIGTIATPTRIGAVINIILRCSKQDMIAVNFTNGRIHLLIKSLDFCKLRGASDAIQQILFIKCRCRWNSNDTSGNLTALIKLIQTIGSVQKCICVQLCGAF